MDPKKKYEFKKLNDLLCTSFNNVKYDFRSLNERLETLKNHLANLSADSVYKALEEQNKIILEQQQSINLLMSRLEGLEALRKEAKETKQESHVIWLEAPEPKKTAKTEHKKDVFDEFEKAIASPKKSESKKSEKIIPKNLYSDIKEGEVRITKVQFKSPGNGKKDLNGEWIEITGFNVDMNGYKLHDKSKKHTFTFPHEFVIYGPVKIFSGKGKNTNTKLFWNNPRPIWNDKGDIVTLKDAKGRIVSRVKSEPAYTMNFLK